MCSNEHPAIDLLEPSDLSACTPFTNEEPEVPLQNHTVSFASKGTSARVARVAYCQDATCSFAGLSPHLSVEIYDVPLEPNNATAISYAWGDFHREKISIGHMRGNTSAHVQLELGKEWVIRDFVNRLAELAKDAPIWIDQICVLQKEEAIRQVLADIPSIFRTFDVAALMPGHPCKCLDDFLEKHMLLHPTAGDKMDRRKMKKIWDVSKHHCLNILAPSSWFGRVWTRQEFMYSRRIRCVWASAQRAKCVSRDALEKKDLEPYMALLYEQLEANGFSKRSILLHLRHFQRMWYIGAFSDLTAYLKQPRGTILSPFAHALRFFGRETLQNGRATADYLNMPLRGLIGEFVRELRWIGLSSSESVPRRATHSRDYVVSVWVDCPSYTVPQGYKMMDAPELLDDATAQLMHKHGIAILTNAPRGLFDSEKSGSAVFDPVTHFFTTPIQHVAELYGPISTERPPAFFVHQTGAVPVLLSARYPVALSIYAEEYTVFSERFDKGKASSLIPFFQHVFKLCSKACTLKFRHHILTMYDRLSEEMYKPEYNGKVSPGELLSVRHSVALLAKLVCKHEYARRQLGRGLFDILNDYATLSDDIFDDILETALYDLTAASLGISREACRAAGVAIMIDPGNPSVTRPPRIGFFRGDVDLRQLQRIQDPGMGTKRAITVCMSTNPERQGFTSNELGHAATLFEAYQVEQFGSEDVPKYRVFRVWIPTAATKAEEYGAWLGSLKEGGADAFLV